ncbi:MAG: response regulator transcription factor [Candidatus Neoclostridium sp.]
MRILLAEDDKSLARAVETILKKNNYTVDVVYNGADALSHIDSDLYDAVILDIMMPYADGITVLKTARKNGRRVPVLLLTAKYQIEDKVEGLDAGANDYLTKPFDFRELLARLRCITRAPEAQPDNTLRVGNVTLNDADCSLSTPLGGYTLTNKEFGMMKLFMSSPGKIISADRFLEKLWDLDSNAEANTVWTYVSYLRRKLEALSANVRITTKRNLGYALEEIK